MTMKRAFISLFSLLISTQSLAAVKVHDLRSIKALIIQKEWPACVEPASYYDKVYCSGKVYILIDTVLNQSYKELRAKLTGQQKNQLKTVQIRWVRNRDDTCAKLENDQVIMNLDCATEATVESFYYINAMNKSPSEFDVLLEEYKVQK